MAPSSMIQPLPLDLHAAREKSRLKKPRVEKLRRSRINGSIEQLKALLVKEFQRCQPSSKLEKADVLEMTVSYLRHSQTVAPLSSTCTAQDYGRGYSSCLKETLQFLGTHSASHEAQRKLLNHLQMFWEAAAAKNNPPPPCTPGRLQEGPSQNASSKPSCVLWRPWERGEEFGLGRTEAIAELVVLSRELRVLQQPQATL